MTMGVPAVAIHTVFLGVYAFTWYSLHVLDNRNPAANDPRLETHEKLKLRFLTHWTHTLQMVYFAVCVLGHIVGLIGAMKLKYKIIRTADYINLSVATPAALLVTTTFWSLYAIDRELVFPKVLDLIIPSWVNHSIHSINAVCALVDLICIHHTLPSWSASLKGLVLYFVVYAVCLFGTYVQTGLWLYPVLREMTWPLRSAFTLSIAVFACLMLAVTRGIYAIVWGRSLPPGNSEKNKKAAKPKKK